MKQQGHTGRKFRDKYKDYEGTGDSSDKENRNIQCTHSKSKPQNLNPLEQKTQWSAKRSTTTQKQAKQCFRNMFRNLLNDCNGHNTAHTRPTQTIFTHHIAVRATAFPEPTRHGFQETQHKPHFSSPEHTINGGLQEMNDLN